MSEMFILILTSFFSPIFPCKVNVSMVSLLLQFTWNWAYLKWDKKGFVQFSTSVSVQCQHHLELEYFKTVFEDNVKLDYEDLSRAHIPVVTHSVLRKNNVHCYLILTCNWYDQKGYMGKVLESPFGITSSHLSPLMLNFLYSMRSFGQKGNLGKSRFVENICRYPGTSLDLDLHQLSKEILFFYSSMCLYLNVKSLFGEGSNWYFIYIDWVKGGFSIG